MRLRPRCLVAVLVRVEWWLCSATVYGPFPLLALRLQMGLHLWFPSVLLRWVRGPASDRWRETHWPRVRYL